MATIFFSIFVLSFATSIVAEETVIMVNDVSTTTAATQPPSANPSSTESSAKNETTLESIATAGIVNFTLQFQNILFHLSSSDGNVLFAPVNIIGALATLLLGAEADSKTEILEVLGLVSGRNLANKEEDIHLALGKLLEKFVSDHENNTAIKVLVANGIFVQKDIKIEQQFLNLAQKIYKNEIETVDFAAPADAAVKTINQWAASHTNGKINEIIQPPVMPNTQLILASTLFFNGEWESPFFENSTWEHFFSEDGIVEVKMMVNHASAYVYESAERNFTVLGLPYKGKGVVMYIILPNKDQHLKDIIAHLTLKDISDIAEKSSWQDEVSYLLPYMELSENINVETALKQAGVKTLFDPSKANLSKIANNVHVSDAIHKVNLHVTEAGSTGSAATSLTIETRFPDQHVFHFNRPFAFYVFHKSTGLISFWGSINIPVPHKKVH